MRLSDLQYKDVIDIESGSKIGNIIDITISENLDDCTVTQVTYNLGDVVYYNPETDAICTDYVEANSERDVTSGCLKWYVYNVNGNKTKLILDHNIDSSMSVHYQLSDAEDLEIGIVGLAAENSSAISKAI